jgi:hypothetical protein
VQARFERRLRERWGEALDEYEVIVEIALMMGWQFTQRWFLAARAARDHRTVGLIELRARCCRVAQEVLALLYAAFVPGRPHEQPEARPPGRLRLD